MPTTGYTHWDHREIPDAGDKGPIPQHDEGKVSESCWIKVGESCYLFVGCLGDVDIRRGAEISGTSNSSFLLFKAFSVWSEREGVLGRHDTVFLDWCILHKQVPVDPILTRKLVIHY